MAGPVEEWLLPDDNWLHMDEGHPLNDPLPRHYNFACCEDFADRGRIPRNYKLIIRPPEDFEDNGAYFMRDGNLFVLKCVYCQCLNLGLALDDPNVFDVPREFEEAEFDECEIVGLWE